MDVAGGAADVLVVGASSTLGPARHGPPGGDPRRTGWDVREVHGRNRGLHRSARGETDVDHHCLRRREPVVAAIAWRHWGNASASATGVLRGNESAPSCVAGHWHHRAITFRATNIGVRHGRPLYAQLYAGAGV